MPAREASFSARVSARCGGLYAEQISLDKRAIREGQNITALVRTGLHQPRGRARHRRLDHRQRRRARDRRRARPRRPRCSGYKRRTPSSSPPSAAVRQPRRPVRPRQRLLLIGVVLFAAASVGAAFAPTADLLIGARLVQGVGGAKMLPSTLSLLNATFRGARARHRLRRLGLDDRRHGRGRAAPGRMAHDRVLVAVGVRHQRALGILIIIGVLWAVSESREARVGASTSSARCCRSCSSGRSCSASSRAHPGLVGGERPFTIGGVDVALRRVARAVRVRPRGARPRRVHRAGRVAARKRASRRCSTRACSRSRRSAAATSPRWWRSAGFGIILSLPLWLQFVLGFSARRPASCCSPSPSDRSSRAGSPGR